MSDVFGAAFLLPIATIEKGAERSIVVRVV